LEHHEPAAAVERRDLQGVVSNYAVTELGHLDGYGLNSAGDVAGRLTPPGHAAFYSGGTTQDLGTLGGQTSGASAVNDSQLIVGNSEVADGNTHAFLYDGNLTDLSSPLGARMYSRANDVTNDGTIVGAATFGPGGEAKKHAFLYDTASDTVTDLGTLPGHTTSGALAVNGAGDAVGGSAGDDYYNRPVLFSQGTVTQLMDVVGTAFAINNVGQIVVGTWAGAFLIDNGQATQLQVNGIPYAINDAGEIVGWGIGKTPNVVGPDQFGFLIRNGQLIDLNTWAPPGWQITVAYDINENSQISALMITGNESRGILLTPTEQQPFSAPELHAPELYARILFGVTKDGGGLALVGKHPTPIDPWGPVWSRLAQEHPDALRALALAATASGLTDRRTRADIEKIALAVLQRATQAL
jgi:probable HAF family extracellular repeat protein